MSESPKTYVIEVLVTGYEPAVVRLGAEQFDDAFALFEILLDVQHDTDYPLTVNWSVEY
jgi:hypothetical protein